MMSILLNRPPRGRSEAFAPESWSLRTRIGMPAIGRGQNHPHGPGTGPDRRVSPLPESIQWAVMGDPLIEVRGLAFRYPDGTEALRGVDFVLREAETVAIFGANGSGKTTFLNHLVGLLEGEGSVSVCGMEVDESNLPAVRQRVGMLFQDSDDQIFMPTIEEDVAFGPLNMGLDEETVRNRVNRSLDQVGLNGQRTRPPHHLSAGERRRAALAGVLATEPEILLLDEPASFLDPPGRKALIQTLRSLPQAKVLVTHEVAVAEALAARAVFFEHGRITGEGSVAEIANRFDWH